MLSQNRFIISYFCDNKTGMIEISSDMKTLSVEEAKKYIRLACKSESQKITDIQITEVQSVSGLHPFLNYY